MLSARVTQSRSLGRRAEEFWTRQNIRQTCRSVICLRDKTAASHAKNINKQHTATIIQVVASRKCTLNPFHLSKARE